MHISSTLLWTRCIYSYSSKCMQTCMCCVLWGQMDSLWNQHKSELGTAGSPAFSLCRGLSCHPPYRSAHCNVKYHRTLEDIIWQFCQGSLEYFFLIAQIAAGRKWLPCEFLTACFLLMGKITWFKMHRNKWTGSSFTHGLCGFTVHI